MPRRRRWTVAVVACAGVLVLLGAVVGSAAVREPQPVVAGAASDPAPVGQSEAPVPSRPPVQPVAQPLPVTATPAPTPSMRRPSAQPAPAVAPVRAADSGALGPPPGPQRDERPARTAAPADRYAFLVGVQDYRRPTRDTIGSVGDVRLVRQSLLDAGWLPQHIRTVTDAEVTGGAVRDGLRWLTGRSAPGTFAFFHYSGLVKQLGGGTEALWPVDRDFVRDTELTRLLREAQGRLWVDVAGCEAGSFLPGLPSDRVLVTVSSRGDEKSYENPAWGRSVWTGLLFDLGTAQGLADADRDGRTTIGEATRYATYYAQQITLLQRPHGRQTPQTEGDPVRGWTLADPPA